MEQLSKALYEAGHKSFDLSIERLVVLLRIALTLFCLAVIVTASDPSLHDPEPLIIILSIYATFGLCVAILPTLGKVRTGWQLPVHFVDVGIISVLMSIVDVYSTTFFVLYIFVLLSATFRWNFSGALWTTIGLLVLQTLPPWAINNLTSIALRSSFVVTVGGVFMFFGAWRESSEKRLAQIAAWPENSMEPHSKDGDRWLTGSMSHLSEVFHTPRVAILWEVAQEPYYFLAIYFDHELRKERVVGRSVDHVISPEIDGETFAIENLDSDRYLTPRGLLPQKKPIFDNAFRERLKLESVCTAAFRGELCKGRIFFLDRPNWGDDDLIMADIAASRIRIELEYHIARKQLEEAAASRERIRLASDLHDGILQSLTAAGMRLKLITSESNSKMTRQLDQIRDLLLSEQHQIRAFVEERLTPGEAKDFNLHHQLRYEAQELERQWGCIVLMSVIPEDAKVGQDLVRQLEFLLAETVANAVKHGKARQVKVELEKKSDALQIHVADNGCGITGLTGTYGQKELANLGLAPGSISARVTELGGDYLLSSSSEGLELHIALPCNE